LSETIIEMALVERVKKGDRKEGGTHLMRMGRSGGKRHFRLTVIIAPSEFG